MDGGQTEDRQRRDGGQMELFQMPHAALTHEQCRAAMCAACGARAGERALTPALGEKVRRWAQPSWSPEVMSYPSGICEYCRRLLGRCEKEGVVDLPDRPGATQRWKDFQLECITVPRGQLASQCICPICSAHRCSPVKGTLTNVTPMKSQIVTKKEEPEDSEEDVEMKKKEDNSKMCQKCLQPRVGRGIPHSCTEANRKKNLAMLVLEDQGSEQIAAKVVKDIVEKKKAESVNDDE
jgi:hypothetical protein